MVYQRRRRSWMVLNNIIVEHKALKMGSQTVLGARWFSGAHR